ncbi:hypothetical protein M885DRAFT_610070 [Pelagophyceae sp. CCMP2097]|nr:hypothetical protein M885DRAFT_610070 [Pelagophyceae sp. CCMP2097]
MGVVTSERSPMLAVAPQDAGVARTPAASLRARCLLVIVALLYATMDVCMRIIFLLEEAPKPATVAAVKALLGFVIFVPVVASLPPRRSTSNLWPLALSLAVWSALSNELVFAGQSRIDANRAAFLLQLSVVCTPLLELVALRRAQPKSVWIGAAVALAGVALMAANGGEPSHPPDAAPAADPQTIRHEQKIGDALIILGSFVWGWYLIVTASAPPAESIRIQAMKSMISCVFYAGYAVIDASFSAAALKMGWRAPAAWALVAYCAAVPGSLADVLQQLAQSQLRASEACLYLSLEPVFALGLAHPILGERPKNLALLGSFFVFAATAVVALAPTLPSRPEIAVKLGDASLLLEAHQPQP